MWSYCRYKGERINKRQIDEKNGYWLWKSVQSADCSYCTIRLTSASSVYVANNNDDLNWKNFCDFCSAFCYLSLPYFKCTSTGQKNIQWDRMKDEMKEIDKNFECISRLEVEEVQVCTTWNKRNWTGFLLINF